MTPDDDLPDTLAPEWPWVLLTQLLVGAAAVVIAWAIAR